MEVYGGSVRWRCKVEVLGGVVGWRIGRIMHYLSGLHFQCYIVYTYSVFVYY